MDKTILDEKRTLKIISLDDIKAYFETEEPRQEYVVSESIPILSNSIGNLDNTSPLDPTLETIETLEKSIDSVVPKVPLVIDDSLKKMKIEIKKKMSKKTVREELKDVHFDEIPERANLENTLVLNAEILRQELAKSEKVEKKAKTNRVGRNIVVAMFASLIIFSVILPYLVEYIF